jgi:hypothetical protein
MHARFPKRSFFPPPTRHSQKSQETHRGETTSVLQPLSGSPAPPLPMASPRPARSPPVHSSPRPGSPRRPSISHARVLGQISSAATADGVHLPPQASGNVGQPPDLLRSMEFPPPLLMHPSCLLVSLLPCLLVYLFVHISLDLFLVCIDAQQ